MIKGRISDATSLSSGPAWPASARRIGCAPKASARCCTRSTRTTVATRRRSSTRRVSCSISARTSRSRRTRASRTCSPKTSTSKYEAVQVKLDNYWRGLRLTHPVQLHLNGLPHDLIVEIIADFVKASTAAEQPIANYEDWLIASYGRKFAELFPMTYTRKYHTHHRRQHDHRLARARACTGRASKRCCGARWRRGPRRPLHHQLPLSHATAVSCRTCRTFPTLADIRLGHQLVAVDPRARSCASPNGRSRRLRRAGVVGAAARAHPDDRGRAAGRGRGRASGWPARPACSSTSGWTVPNSPKAQITYIYDEDICLHPPELPAHAVGDQCARRLRQHPGRGLLLAEVPAAHPVDRTDLIDA